MATFAARLVEADRGGAYVHIPPEVVEELGGKGRVPVRATFDGIPYDGSVVTMGGTKVLGVLKAIRTQLGKHPGDLVTVTLVLDDRERTVEVPDDLGAALERAGLREGFDALSYTHQREHVMSIVEAKRPETRARRIAATVDQLREKR